jgi:hypothetical protein
MDKIINTMRLFLSSLFAVPIVAVVFMSLSRFGWRLLLFKITNHVSICIYSFPGFGLNICAAACPII